MASSVFLLDAEDFLDIAVIRYGNGGDRVVIIFCLAHIFNSKVLISIEKERQNCLFRQILPSCGLLPAR